MIKLFRSTRIAYYLSYFSGVLLLFLLSWFIFFTGHYGGRPIFFLFVALLCLLIYLWAFICAFIFESIAIKKMNNINQVMTNDCDFHKYIATMNDLLQKNGKYNTTKRAINRTRTYLLLNLSTAFLNIGDNATVAQVLSDVNYFPNNRTGAKSKVVYYNNLCLYYLRIKDIPSAAQALEQMNTALQNGKLRPLTRERYLTFYTGKQFLLNMENGNYDGCKPYFNALYDKETSVLGKVSAKFTLGKIYLHENRTAEAKQAFEYVIANGGASYYANQAKEYLNQLAQ